ncbi:MAG: hypothetical protein JXA73_08890 [Acidobacteria bacterium]|nr:hypothetical protein [Acidobacteriota bacterium]
MSWRKVTLTFRQVEKGADDQLLDEIDKVFMNAGYPKEAAVFGRIDLTNNCCFYYFNPEACAFCSNLLVRWDAIECMDPGSGIVRLIGRRDPAGSSKKSADGK